MSIDDNELPKATVVLFQGPDALTEARDEALRICPDGPVCYQPGAPDCDGALFGQLDPVHDDSQALVYTPGEIMRAERGVLILTDMPRFSLDTLERIGKAWRVGAITVRRERAMMCAGVAPFELIVTAASCGCGFTAAGFACACSEQALEEYKDHVSRCLEAIGGMI